MYVKYYLYKIRQELPTFCLKSLAKYRFKLNNSQYTASWSAQPSVWDGKIRNKCSYLPGKTVTALKTDENLVSEEGQFSVTLTNKREQHCSLSLWTTLEGLLLDIDHNSTIKVESPMEQELKYFKEQNLVQHTTTVISLMSYILRDLEELTYSLFSKTWQSICHLQEQRYIWLKYLLHKGDAPLVAKMLTNSMAVNGIELGEILAVYACNEIQHYNLSTFSLDRCFTTIPITYTVDKTEHKASLIPATRNLINFITSRNCDMPIKKYIKSIDRQTLYYWNGTTLQHVDNVNYTNIQLVDAMPNHTHLHLLSSLVDDSKDADMESMVGLMQSSAENIVRLLQMSNGNNILFDPHAITETARQTVDFVAEIAESTLSHLFPIYKIITYVIVALVRYHNYYCYCDLVNSF
jgi:hypothetical protein